MMTADVFFIFTVTVRLKSYIKLHYWIKIATLGTAQVVFILVLSYMHSDNREQIRGKSVDLEEKYT